MGTLRTTGYTSTDVQRIRLENKYAHRMVEDLSLGKYVSYVGNRDIPLLRLYRYKEAFAFEFVKSFLKKLGAGPNDFVFDPFAGMGTTLFTSMIFDIPSIGVDKLPIATFIAETLPKFLLVKKGELRATYEDLLTKVDKANTTHIAMDVPIINSAFREEVLERLRRWKGAMEELSSPLKDIFFLLLFSILESTSLTSKDGQFLRLKRDKETLHPDEALGRQVLKAEEDLDKIKWLFPDILNGRKPKVFLADTKDLSSIPFSKKPTIMITSPPYVNRYDYTRSYCLELCFHFVRNFEELKAIRLSILRSHIESRLGKHETPNHPAIEEVLSALQQKELNNPKIPQMITAYFIDMRQAIREWSRIMSDNAQIALVVDNVRFEGELIPVDLVLSEMAEEEGFKVQSVVISRYKGNSSQQMKKYGRVPVRESIVRWERA